MRRWQLEAAAAAARLFLRPPPPRPPAHRAVTQPPTWTLGRSCSWSPIMMTCSVWRVSEARMCASSTSAASSTITIWRGQGEGGATGACDMRLRHKRAAGWLADWQHCL